MDEAEIYRFIYLPQQMILRHQVFQQNNLVFLLPGRWLFSQHVIHPFMYIFDIHLLFPFGFFHFITKIPPIRRDFADGLSLAKMQGWR